jgi:hypothetical protein
MSTVRLFMIDCNKFSARWLTSFWKLKVHIFDLNLVATETSLAYIELILYAIGIDT